MKHHVISGICVVLLSGCSSVFHNSFDDGTKVEFMTMSNLWSPNVTIVKIHDQEGYLVYNGSASMNQAWTMGAGTAAAGYWIGDGIKGQESDRINQQQKQEGGDSSVVSNIDNKMNSFDGDDIVEINIED